MQPFWTLFVKRPAADLEADATIGGERLSGRLLLVCHPCGWY